MSAIILENGASISGPDDPGLARVWDVAVAKYRQRHGGAVPSDRSGAREVLEEYHRLAGKARGSLGEVVSQIVREHCVETRTEGG